MWNFIRKDASSGLHFDRTGSAEYPYAPGAVVYSVNRKNLETFAGNIETIDGIIGINGGNDDGEEYMYDRIYR